MNRGVLVVSVLGTMLAAIAAGLMLYISAAMFLNQVYPFLEQGQLEAARILVLGMEFSGVWTVVPVFVYLLLGFFALALGVRQSHRAARAWRGNAMNRS